LAPQTNPLDQEIQLRRSVTFGQVNRGDLNIFKAVGLTTLCALEVNVFVMVLDRIAMIFA
jgi:hypothetical protein